MHKLNIKMEGPGRGEVMLDDRKLEGVTAVDFSAAVDRVSTAVIALNVLEANIEAGTTRVAKTVRTAPSYFEYFAARTFTRSKRE
jgi:hypothetical protein